MDKLSYTKELITEANEQVYISAYNNWDIYMRLIDDEGDWSSVTLTLKEAQRVKRYLEDAITTHIINLEEEK